ASKKGSPGDARVSFASVDNDCVTIETLKGAEDGKGLILRIFEHANRRASTKLTFGPKIKSVTRVNLMEEGNEPMTLDGNAVTLQLRPFEITTLRVIPA
ncbi:MAG TPA: glycosyl hydrolase-related protein, partial [Devosia sp.]